MSNLDIELGLISAVLESGDMRTPVSQKIRGNYFQKGPNKVVWEYMLNHYREFKKVPSLEALQRKFPDFEPIKAPEPVEYFIEELKDRQRYNLILKGMQRISQGLTAKNSHQAMKELSRLVSRINAEVQISRDILWNEEVDERIARMERRMKNFGVDGISYMNERFDYATGGMHGGELITIVGKPSTGKTYAELAIIAKPALLQGEDVLFISREMAPEEIEDRMDSIMFEIPADTIRRGLFTTEQFEEYKQNLYNLKNKDWGRFIVSGDDEKGFGVTAVQAKIEEHLPGDGGVVIIDGSYLLDDEDSGRNASTWEKISNITRGLKRLARKTGKVIVQSSQLGRGQKQGKSVDLDNISFSSSFHQDSDIVWSLTQSEEMKAVGKMKVEGSKIRNGPPVEAILNWDFSTMKDFGKLAEDITDMPDDDEDTIIY